MLLVSEPMVTLVVGRAEPKSAGRWCDIPGSHLGGRNMLAPMRGDAVRRTGRNLYRKTPAPLVELECEQVDTALRRAAKMRERPLEAALAQDRNDMFVERLYLFWCVRLTWRARRPKGGAHKQLRMRLRVQFTFWQSARCAYWMPAARSRLPHGNPATCDREQEEKARG